MNRRNKVGYYTLPVILGLMFLLMPLLSFAEGGTALSDSLRSSLKSQGWQEYQAEDGSTIYRKPGAAVEAGGEPGESEELQRQQLAEALGARGWLAEWQPDGTLVIRRKEDAPAASSLDVVEAATTEGEQLPDLPGFKFWRIERGDDGSMLFHPADEAQIVDSPAADQLEINRCEGYGFTPQGVSLPVDEWSEAKALSEAWLTASGIENVQVGRIRKVLRIYLASLVSDTAPYTLVHQLAIRASDGHVMLLE
ncbi:MAG: hypothetical protein ABW153_19230 [Sedimenticola sp.]